MSYILDALKRADQERKQGDIPDLRSVPPATIGDAKRRSLLLPTLLIAAAALALLWFRPGFNAALNTGMKTQNEPTMPAVPSTANGIGGESGTLSHSSAQPPTQSNVAQSNSTQSNAAAQPATVQNGFNQNSTAQQLPNEKSMTASESINANTGPAVEPADAGNKPVALPGVMELPAHIRNTLPSIKISGHIYDENPASRMVIINDKVMREGRHINDALSIDQITDSGIILNQNGTRFFMSTFDSWPR